MMDPQNGKSKTQQKKLSQMKALQQSIVAGALFDFCAMLSSVSKPFYVGKGAEVGRLMHVLGVFGKARGLDLTSGANCMDWEKRLQGISQILLPFGKN